MDLGIAGRRAAVAAGSAGLGLAVARSLAAEGVRVAICGRTPDRVTAAAEEHGLVGIVADVSTPEGAVGFVREARAELGGVDIVVGNAGGPPGGGFSDFPDPQSYADAFALNALSTIAMCQDAVPEMRDRGWGRIVAITSIAARQASPHLILSATARAGLTGFLKTLAIDVASDGITVNSLQPGLHATDRLRQLYGGDVAAAAGGVPTGELGRPEDFGEVAAFLCSDAARFVTGSAILVDGGAYLGLQ
ncbi:MAG: SDR family oxidoreductase [Acidimicrobiia bacterium]|jgi:3-oxoacyl-[acyl-carrier protein] reductase